MRAAVLDQSGRMPRRLMCALIAASSMQEFSHRNGYTPKGRCTMDNPSGHILEHIMRCAVCDYGGAARLSGLTTHTSMSSWPLSAASPCGTREKGWRAESAV